MDGTLGAAVGFTKDFARTLKKCQIKLLLILIIFVFLTVLYLRFLLDRQINAKWVGQYEI